ncbi:GDSL-type esterase/lipase family protein [Pseudofrankia inefficax]|uniref:GDSL-type esterase/lipase family protein n=1 Tax=Pseudofrankia inefficax (strain DSM 45817 / CECT 9037 / DDB 130130 / EuI1c) TaxID=298654 RepID=UPI0012FE4B0D|nr:GDSL-type esterase/lipase family protein [Pseudofrankia inefficax]
MICLALAMSSGLPGLTGTALAVAASPGGGSGPASATPAGGTGGAASTGAPQPGAGGHVPVPAGDVAALAVGTPDGVNVLVPNSATVGGWRELTNLSVQGWDTPMWTEFHCVTGDGRYMAVTFAPIGMADDETLRDEGAFGAIVDLRTGSRWVLPVRVGLKYYSPGCGTGTDVVFSRNTGTDHANTELIRVDAAGSKIRDRRTVTGRVASAVPTAKGVAAADGSRVISVAANGGTSTLATAPGAVFDLRPSSSDGLDYLAVTGPTTSKAFRRGSNGKVAELADGPLRNMALWQGRGGKNHLVGRPSRVAGGNPIDVLGTDTQPADLSLEGGLVVDGEDVPGGTAPTKTTSAITIRNRSRSGGAATATQVTAAAADQAPAASASPAPSSLAPGTLKPNTLPSGGAAGSGSPCAVAPLDPSMQVIQPSPAQIQWSAYRAVSGGLTTQRPANWEKHGLPAYTPASLIPIASLAGAPSGGHIPTQVLEGVLAQESNFSQASWRALPGIASDPLIANYYGTAYSSDGSLIVGANPANADCGYGVGQITSGMTGTATSPWSDTVKLAIATDYEVNELAAVKMLTDFWNQLYGMGILANNGDPTKIENWYFAIWAYNTGIHTAPLPSNYHSLGLGWTNNPAQNDYPPNRQPFLSVTYDDAAHPSRWPYQEKVLGWAANSQLDLINGGFKYTASGILNLPQNYFLFCTSANNCSQTNTSGGYCNNADRSYCAWHTAVTWTSVDRPDLASENPAGDVGGGEPAVADPYPASCSAAASPVVQTPGTTALPGGAVIVDELSSSATNLAGCATTSSAGTFALTYGTDSSGHPLGAIDTHQLGVGYMGHTYFARTVALARASASNSVGVTGTWTPPSSVTGWQRIWVHIPDNGADTQQADYIINTGTTTKDRIVNQRWNQNSWFDLGSYQLSAGAYVYLTNVTNNDWNHTVDLAWDAIAFTPSSKPAVDYVALGDSYQAGEGVQPYYGNADRPVMNGIGDACHRSPQAYSNTVFNALRAAHPGDDEFHFLACSGAVINDINGQHYDQGEVPQLYQNWLDENTTNVTIGIGGNDSRFSTIVQACLLDNLSSAFSQLPLNGPNCMASDFHLTFNGTVDPQPLTVQEPIVIDGLKPRLVALYQQIHSLAPNAKITVLGYPHIVTTGSLRLDICTVAINPDLAQWFADMADRLDSVTSQAVSEAGVGATFVNPVSTFSGPPDHGACTFHDGDEWINSLVPHSSTGSGSTNPGPGSFHPDAAGHGADAGLINASLGV